MKKSMDESNIFEARIAVGYPPEPQSGIYRIWNQKGKSNIFVSVRDIADQIKISLHESGECNAGLTGQFAQKEMAAVAAMGGSRHQSRWIRRTHTGSRVITPLQIVVPATELNKCSEYHATKKKITWIAPPEAGHSIIISCMFSGQYLSDDEWPGRNNGTQLIGIKILPNGEKFWLIWQNCPTDMLEHKILSEANTHLKQQKIVRFSGIRSDDPPPQRRLIFREFFDNDLLIILDALIKSKNRNIE
jgi:hypothetical protein